MSELEIMSKLPWGSYGFPGVVLFITFMFIWFLIKEHKAERKEWLTFAEKLNDRNFSISSETITALQALTRVIEVHNTLDDQRQRIDHHDNRR